METNYKLLDENEKLKSKDNDLQNEFNQCEEQDDDNINFVNESQNNNNNFSLDPSNSIIETFGIDSPITKIIFCFCLIHPFMKLFCYRNPRVISLFTRRQLRTFEKIAMGIMLFCLLITIVGIKNVSPHIINMLQIIILFYILLHIYLFSNSAFVQNFKNNGFKLAKK